MRSVVRWAALGAAVIAAYAGCWALLLAASAALIRRDDGWSGAGIALDVLTGLFLVAAVLVATFATFLDDAVPARSRPGATLGWIGFALTAPTMLLGFGAALESGSAGAGRLVPATVAGAAVTAGLYLVGTAMRGREVAGPGPAPGPVAAAPAEDWTVGELRASVAGLPDGTELRAEIVDGVIMVLAGDRFVATGPQLRKVVDEAGGGEAGGGEAGSGEAGSGEASSGEHG